MLAITPPFFQYADADGSPLDDGLIWFGLPNQNPETNPVSVYWDEAGTQPAVHPVMTSGGYPVRAGNISRLYIAADYSVTVRNKRGVTVYSDASASSGTAIALGLDLANGAVASKGAGLVAFNKATEYLAGSAGATLSNVAHEINVREYGASVSASAAANRAALRAAILAANAAGGGVVRIPTKVNWGLVTNNPATLPDFSTCTADIKVTDSSNTGTADGTNKIGAGERTFFYTAQTTPPGQHDGNGFAAAGDWAPYFKVENTAVIAAVGDPSRTAYDNRRARYWTFTRGKAKWSWGQGSQEGAGLTEPEMQNFLVECYNSPLGESSAGASDGSYAPMLIDFATGRMAFGVGTNDPMAAFHFRPLVTAYAVALFESFGTDNNILQRTSAGSGGDVRITNSATQWVVQVAAGTLMQFDKSSKASVFGGPVGLPAFTKAATPSATGFLNQAIVVTDAIGGRTIALSNGANWISMITGSAV